MAYLTGQTEQGCCANVTREGDLFECAPAVPERVFKNGNTNTWHMFFAKAVGQPGEDIKIRIKWPVYAPERVSETLKKAANFEADWQSFVTAARDAVFMSADRVHWTRIEDVKLEDSALYFEARLPASECWFSVTLYYTPANYADLRRAVAESPYVKTMIIGRDSGGDEIYAFQATDFSVPEAEKQTVFLQGAQHCSEFGGAHLCDFMLRWFAEGSNEARALLKKYAFHLIPVVSVSSWRQGCDVHDSGLNPNRDWVERTLPTTRAVHGYLNALSVPPALLIDVHTGLANYGCWTICQALSVNTALSEGEQAAMRRFVDAVYETCDFLPTRRYWEDVCTDQMFDGYGTRYGQTHTMEISHYALYDRGAGRHFPTSQAGLARFARQLPGAIDRFLTGERSGEHE